MSPTPAAIETTDNIRAISCNSGIQTIMHRDLMQSTIDSGMRSAEVREVLKTCEWSATPGIEDDPLCPLCGNFDGNGHAPDCLLASLIAHYAEGGKG